MNKILSFIFAVIFGVSLAETPATPTDLEYTLGPLEIIDGLEEEDDAPEPYVIVEVLNTGRQIYIGDEVTLVCVVVGMRHGKYDIQWQYCDDIEAGEYHDIDCHDHEYTFVADYDNTGYYYRVVIHERSVGSDETY